MTKRYTGGEIIADYLIANKVEYIAGIPGHGCLPIFDAIRDRVRKGQIKYIQVKQEMSGVHMADGYYRASGKPMAVLTSIGPGALNTAIGVATSFVDSTPLLIISGDAHVHMRGVGILQEIERHHDSDFLSCMRPITKRCWRVENIAQLPKIMQRAFEQMMTGRKGPVLLSVPMDVQADSIETAIGKYINEKDYEYDLIGSEQLVDNAIQNNDDGITAGNTCRRRGILLQGI